MAYIDHTQDLLEREETVISSHPHGPTDRAPYRAVDDADLGLGSYAPASSYDAHEDPDVSRRLERLREEPVVRPRRNRWSVIGMIAGALLALVLLRLGVEMFYAALAGGGAWLLCWLYPQIRDGIPAE